MECFCKFFAKNAFYYNVNCSFFLIFAQITAFSIMPTLRFQEYYAY